MAALSTASPFGNRLTMAPNTRQRASFSLLSPLPCQFALFFFCCFSIVCFNFSELDELTLNASFLLTTHYARYDLHPRLFALNFVSLLLLAVWPKLPAMHRLRFKFFTDAQSASGSGTPDRGNNSRSRAASPSAQLTESSLRNLNLARGSASYHYQAQQPPIQEVSEPSTPVLTTSSNWTPARLKSRLFNKK